MTLFLLLMLQVQTTGPPPQNPCMVNPSAPCIIFTMMIDGYTRAFTEIDFGRPPDTIQEYAVCQGRLTKGSLRYFVNKTAPSSLVGTVVPAIYDTDPDNGQTVQDTTGTLEADSLINLHNRELITGFKATQANWGGAELSWECSL